MSDLLRALALAKLEFQLRSIKAAILAPTLTPDLVRRFGEDHDPEAVAQVVALVNGASHANVDKPT